MNKYSIVIPIFNESENILDLVNGISRSLNKKFKYEIIMVDDNSNDGSVVILNKILRQKKNFKFFIRKEKKDLSKSVIFGIEKTKFENLIIMDGDLQHNPKYLPILINEFQRNKLDILVATRNFKKREGLSFVRFFISKSLIFFINLLFKKQTSDPMSGFFLIKKNVFNKSKKKLYGKGYKILFDIILSSNIKKILDYQIKFKIRKKNKSKMNLIVIMHLILLIFSKLTY